MTATHDYTTKLVRADSLNNTMTLVGVCGGLSSILQTLKTPIIPEITVILTEHGKLHLDSEKGYLVLDMD